NGFVVGDADAQLAGTWVLSDRVLPGGDTIAQRYAQRLDLPSRERDIAERIAAARLGLLRVISIKPGRGIELNDLTRAQLVSVISHDLSRSVQPGDLLVGRVMAGPPAPSVWGPVAFVTRRTGQMLSDILKPRLLPPRPAEPSARTGGGHPGRGALATTRYRKRAARGSPGECTSRRASCLPRKGRLGSEGPEVTRDEESGTAVVSGSLARVVSVGLRDCSASPWQSRSQLTSPLTFRVSS